MECLNGYIGIRGCSDSDPESGLYLNDLPGISLKSIDAIADSEQVTYLGVFNDIERRAIRRFETLVTNWLSTRFKLKRVTQSANLGTVTTTDETAASASYRGFTVTLSTLEDYVKSNLHVIHVQSLNLILKEAKNTTVKIYDIVDNDTFVELDSFSVTGAAGQNRVAVNKDYYPTLGLFIAYDSTGIDSLTLDLPTQIGDYCECVCNVYGCEAAIQGAISDKPVTEVSRGTNTYGLSGIVSIGCKWDQFICDNRQIFAVPIWYLYGYEYWSERLHTDRLNRYGTIDRDKIQPARDEMWTAFNEELQTVLEGINIEFDCCVECNAQVKQVVAQL